MTGFSNAPSMVALAKELPHPVFHLWSLLTLFHPNTHAAIVADASRSPCGPLLNLLLASIIGSTYFTGSHLTTANGKPFIQVMVGEFGRSELTLDGFDSGDAAIKTVFSPGTA